MRIALTGTGRLAGELLAGILATPHEVVAIVMDGRRTRGFMRWLLPLWARWFGSARTALGYGVRHGLPIVFIDTMDEAELAPLAAARPDILLVGGFGIILKEPILRVPRLGCVNCHSSLLPRHRGPNPFSAVILAGEPETGVTFHVIDPGIDTGDILAQRAFPLKGNENVVQVYRSACALAGEMVGDLLAHIAREGLHGTPQDPALATYDKKPKVDDAWLDWRDSAVSLERRCRALSPSPMPRFAWKGRVIYVLRTRVAGPLGERPMPGEVVATRPFVRVATGEGSLEIIAGWCNLPLPWLWPMPWNRPRTGDVLE